MNYAALLPTDTPVRTGVIGTGAFGLSFYRQSQRMPGLTIAAVCDLIPAAARRRLVQAGADPEGRAGMRISRGGPTGDGQEPSARRARRRPAGRVAP